MKLHRTWPRLPLIAAILFFSGSVLVEAADDSREDGDCGTASLYALLQLEGFPKRFETVVVQLSPARSSGHSLKELRDAARFFGLTLDGVYVGKDSTAIDRPMLAYLKVDQKGHFLVVRPVGQSGKLVQVIDSNQESRVMEKSDLVSSEQWTGLVLAPRRINWTVAVGLALLAQFCLCGIAFTIVRRRRSSYPAAPTSVMNSEKFV